MMSKMDEGELMKDMQQDCPPRRAYLKLVSWISNDTHLYAVKCQFYSFSTKNMNYIVQYLAQGSLFNLKLL